MRRSIPFTPKALVTVLLVIPTALFGWTDRRRPQYTITLGGPIDHNGESRFNERQIEILENVLPGKPESHGCVRLLQRDAKWLYEWGHGAASCEPDEVPGQGTTVLIVGSYNYGTPPPWYSDGRRTSEVTLSGRVTPR